MKKTIEIETERVVDGCVLEYKGQRIRFWKPTSASYQMRFLEIPDSNMFHFNAFHGIVNLCTSINESASEWLKLDKLRRVACVIHRRTEDEDLDC